MRNFPTGGWKNLNNLCSGWMDLDVVWPVGKLGNHDGDETFSRSPLRYIKRTQEEKKINPRDSSEIFFRLFLKFFTHFSTFNSY